MENHTFKCENSVSMTMFTSFVKLPAGIYIYIYIYVHNASCDMLSNLSPSPPSSSALWAAPAHPQVAAATRHVCLAEAAAHGGAMGFQSSLNLPSGNEKTIG